MKPVAQKVAKEFQKHKQRKVVNLAAAREAREQLGSGPDLPPHIDPEMALILSHYRVVHVTARMLLGARALEKLAMKVDDAERVYMPGGPPASPVTDSLFMTWVLCDLSTGPADENLASILADLVPVLGLPRALQSEARAHAESRLGLYKVTHMAGDKATLFDLVEQKSINVQLIDPWGETGQLWLVRVNQNPQELGSGLHILMTPYLLLASEQDWMSYLRRVSAEWNTETLRRHFKRPPKAEFWLDYVMDGYDGVADGLICLAGVPDMPQSLPHAEGYDSGTLGTPLEQLRDLLWQMAQDSGVADESNDLFDALCAGVGGLEQLSPSSKQLAAAFQIYGYLSEEGYSLAHDVAHSEAAKDHPLDMQRELAAMTKGWFSVFEVRLVRINEGLELFDTLRRKLIFVREKSATQQVSTGDALLAQLLAYEDGTFTLEGAVAHIPRPWVTPYVEELRQLRDRVTSKAKGLDWRTRAGLLIPHAVALLETIAQNPPLPHLVNFDGDDVVWAEAHYDIVERDRTMRWLEVAADSNGPNQWVISGEKALEAALTVRGERLTVQCNSKERLRSFRLKIEKELGAAVRWKVDSFRDAEAMMREARATSKSTMNAPTSSDSPIHLSPEMKDAVAAHMQGMMRSWLDEKIPMLGNKSPRQAIRSARGRAQVTELLLGQERALKSNPQMEAVDLSFMWDELGLTRPEL